MNIDLSVGSVVSANGKRYTVTNNTLALDTIEARELLSGVVERVSIDDISDDPGDTPAAPPLPELDDPALEVARERMRVVEPLLSLPRRRRADIEAAMSALGCGKSTIYRLLNKHARDPRLTALRPTKRPGGRGKSRLDERVEAIVQSVIEETHLTPLQPPTRTTIREIQRRCVNLKLQAPHENTIRTRVKKVPEKESLRRRGQSKTADDRLTARPGHFEDATRPLALVQIDHTRLDIVLVDERYRIPLHRPFLTIALDVYSRMVLSFYISFDAPGALGTGLCIARAVLRKNKWLRALDVEAEWPCWGMPAKIHVDNAQEFRGDMLQRACDQYKIGIDFRPIANPSTGGHVERVLGTISRYIHGLAGAARKPHERGDYDPEANAVMTLPELERHLVTFITGVYHREFHKGICSTPLQRWSEAILGDGKTAGSGLLRVPKDEDRFRIDFMPFVTRTIQPRGVQVDGIFYYADVLRKHLTANSKDRIQHIFHRDPRDISVLYFWDADTERYIDVPYRDATHPPISEWELRAVRRHLEGQGRQCVDERVIFATYNELKRQQEDAGRRTREARKNAERRAVAKREPARATPAVVPAADAGTPTAVALKYELIEPLPAEIDE